MAELSKGGGKNVFFCPWKEGLEPGQKVDAHGQVAEIGGRKRKREGSDEGEVAEKK